MTRKAKAMKRIGNIYEKIISIDNLLQADQNARRGKGYQRGIKEFDKNFEQNIADIYRDLASGTYKTSGYRHMMIHEPKERKISILSYRDRIVQHAIVLQLEKMFVNSFTADTYSCIKGRGTHKMSSKLTDALKDEACTRFCLKLDIRKFYPSVDNSTLKLMIRRKIKDQELLKLLDGIIDSAEGLPIGNLLSQVFGNFYLSPLDHWLKEKKMVRYYFRYLDDMVILGPDTKYLRKVHAGIRAYLKNRLKLDLNSKWQIFLIAKKHRASGRGIDVGGYVHYRDHKRLRKRIKIAFARVAARRRKSKHPERMRPSIESYKGWAKHCDAKHLIKKLLPDEII